MGLATMRPFSANLTTHKTYSKKSNVADVAGPIMHAGILGRDVAEVATKLQREGYDNMRPMSSLDLQVAELLLL